MACCLGHAMNKRLFMGISIVLVILVTILILSSIIYYRQYNIRRK
jgi:DMSO/TMAO reductase YedYZ heme-binding membrane subunit